MNFMIWKRRLTDVLSMGIEVMLNRNSQHLTIIGQKNRRDYYQEWGKEPQLCVPGTLVNIPADVKYWHGAAPDSGFSHLAVEVPGENGSNEWLEPVDDEQYGKCK